MILCDSDQDRESTEKLCLPGDRRLCFVLDVLNPAILSLHTDKKYQSLCRRFLGFHAVLAHAMNDRADKVDGEDTVDVRQVENHGNEQKMVTPELRHDPAVNEWLSRMRRFVANATYVVPRWSVYAIIISLPRN